MTIPYDPSAIITEARNDNWPATVEEFVSSDPYVSTYDNLPVEDEGQRSESGQRVYHSNGTLRNGIDSRRPRCTEGGMDQD